MVKAYPQFRSSYSHEEMVEHFLLTPAELQLVLTCRGDANRCGMALLLKTVSHLGYVPDPMPKIPEEVRAFVAAQLGLLSDPKNLWRTAVPTEDLARGIANSSVRLVLILIDTCYAGRGSGHWSSIVGVPYPLACCPEWLCVPGRRNEQPRRLIFDDRS
jgi:hypothetical protein